MGGEQEVDQTNWCDEDIDWGERPDHQRTEDIARFFNFIRHQKSVIIRENCGRRSVVKD